MGGDSVIGLSSHISVIDHLDMGASVAVAVILLLILCCMCAFRQGWCLTAILGKKWSHLNPENRALTTEAPPQQAQPSTVISMPATTTTNNPMLESLDEELLILQKKNAIIKLQKERASIMELTPAAYNLPYNPKYPVT